MTDIANLLDKPEFPRSNQYEANWMLQNQMGPNALWLVEWLAAIDEVPQHLSSPQSNGKVFWEDECWSFKTADWWRDLWQRSSRVTDVRVDVMPDGWRHWRDFERTLEAYGHNVFPSDADALEADRGRYLGFVRMLAKCTGRVSENLYDAALGARAGVDG